MATSVLNSFAFDFLTRLRTAGTHLSAAFLSRVAVPPVADCQAIPVIETVSAGGTEPPERDDRYFAAVWKANRAVAQAYGLTAEDLEHILSTFPVFARKRPAFYAYLLARVKEWKEESGPSGRRRYASQGAEISFPQAAEDVTPYGKGPETAQNS
jgi:hypothetical protein